MKIMNLTVFCLLCFLLAKTNVFAANAANILIDAPDTPVHTRELIIIGVSGISENDLPNAKVAFTPSDGVTYFAGKTWGGQDSILFLARKPGKYTLSISLNDWVIDLEDAASRAKVDAANKKKLDDIINTLKDNYPSSSATCALEVTGENPPDPPDPPDPAETVMVLLLMEAQEQDRQLKNLVLDIRNDQRLKQVKVQILDEEVKNVNGDLLRDIPESYVAKALKVSREKSIALPIVAGLTTDGDLTFHQKCPIEIEEFIKTLKDKKVKGL